MGCRQASSAKVALEPLKVPKKSVLNSHLAQIVPQKDTLV